MKSFLVFILIMCCELVLGQNKCKFIGYNSYTETAYDLRTYCYGGRHRHDVVYGNRQTTVASFYDYTLKRMFYLKKVESKKAYCNFVSYYNVEWEHKGFKDSWVEDKIYYLNLKNFDYELESN